MTPFEQAREAFFQSEGPNGEPAPVVPPEFPPAPTMSEWIAQHLVVMWHLNAYLLWQAGHPVPQPNLNDEPYSTWEQDWPNDTPETMAAKGHVALYP